MNDIEMILRSRIKELERRLLESQARVHAAEARVKELEVVHPDTVRLDWLEKHAGIDPGNCDIRCESIYEVRFPTGHHYYRHEKHKPFRAAIDAIRQQGGAK